MSVDPQLTGSMDQYAAHVAALAPVFCQYHHALVEGGMPDYIVFTLVRDFQELQLSHLFGIARSSLRDQEG